MTTIAYKDGIMAGDTLAMDPHGLKEYVSKVTAVDIDGDTWLFGSAGESSIAAKLLKQIEQCAHIKDVISMDIEGDPDDKNSALLCRGDAVFRKVVSMWWRVSRNYHAIGSGRDYALAAMYCGKSASEAVEIAKGFDGYTGGDVEVIADDQSILMTGEKLPGKRRQAKSTDSVEIDRNQ